MYIPLKKVTLFWLCTVVNSIEIYMYNDMMCLVVFNHGSADGDEKEKKITVIHNECDKSYLQSVISREICVFFFICCVVCFQRLSTEWEILWNTTTEAPQIQMTVAKIGNFGQVVIKNQVITKIIVWEISILTPLKWHIEAKHQI